MHASEYRPGFPITNMPELLTWLRHQDYLCIRETWADTTGGSGERWVLADCRVYGGTPLAVAARQMERRDIRQAVRTLTTHQEAPADASE